MQSLLDGAGTTISSKTVVGEPVIVGDTTIIPLSDVTIGCAAGANNADRKDSGSVVRTDQLFGIFEDDPESPENDERSNSKDQYRYDDVAFIVYDVFDLVHYYLPLILNL